ncbi:MAG: hypothetical protein D3924_19450 [Candidatus Electrothrix sp. AR4]|nr:hypothetical protein [Candidatus Electrothrix sp. AR4]
MIKSPEQQARKIPRFLGVHARPGRVLRLVLASLPFIFLLAFYLTASEIRHKENPADKLLPRISEMTVAVKRMAFEKTGAQTAT